MNTLESNQPELHRNPRNRTQFLVAKRSVTAPSLLKVRLARGTCRYGANVPETYQFWQHLPPPDRDISLRQLHRDSAVPLEPWRDASSSVPGQLQRRVEG